MSFHKIKLKRCPTCNEFGLKNLIGLGQCLNCNYFDENVMSMFKIRNYFNLVKRIRNEEYYFNLTGELT